MIKDYGNQNLKSKDIIAKINNTALRWNNCHLNQEQAKDKTQNDGLAKEASQSLQDKLNMAHPEQLEKERKSIEEYNELDRWNAGSFRTQEHRRLFQVDSLSSTRETIYNSSMDSD
ncbi:hypothetical protein BD408DRAFT_404323 [Parasitella parasitica]|nr:hypothetical protein BD408DRAFT_404323 [Parasitella parasitica]